MFALKVQEIMSSTFVTGGGCLCGETRYEVTGEHLRGTVCHCLHCRRWSGAPFLSWSIFNSDQFRWTKGTPGTTSVTPAVKLHFCADCGSPLTFEFTDSSNIIGATTGTLDDPEKFPPTRHNWTSRELSWIHNLDSMPRNSGDAGDEKVSIKDQ